VHQRNPHSVHYIEIIIELNCYYEINYMFIQDALWGMKYCVRNVIFLIELCRYNEMHLKSYRSCNNKEPVGILYKQQLLFLP
jgi:hypothetical protein